MEDMDILVYTTTWKKNKEGKYTSHVIDLVKEADWKVFVSGNNMIDAYAGSLVVTAKVKIRYYLNFASVKEFRENHVNTGNKKFYT